MKRSTVLFIFLGILIIAGSLYIITKEAPKDGQAFIGEMRDFSVNEIADIDKIFLADKNDNTVLLTKAGEKWMVNDNFYARPDAIETLLKTIEKVKVKNRIAKEGQPQIIKNLIFRNKKIEIYKDDELVRSYYIGGATPDSRGTYMLLIDHNSGSNSSTPFVTYIEGFEGVLDKRYIVKEEKWRDTRIFSFPKLEFKSLEVKYFNDNADKSFSVNIHDGNLYLSTILNGPPLPYDDRKLKEYLLNYKSISAESFITKNNKNILDSLNQIHPLFEISIVDAADHKTSVKGYIRKAKEGEVDRAGNKIEYDVERLFGIVNEKDLCILQYYQFDRLTKRLQDF